MAASKAAQSSILRFINWHCDFHALNWTHIGHHDACEYEVTAEVMMRVSVKDEFKALLGLKAARDVLRQHRDEVVEALLSLLRETLSGCGAKWEVLNHRATQARLRRGSKISFTIYVDIRAYCTPLQAFLDLWSAFRGFKPKIYSI